VGRASRLVLSFPFSLACGAIGLRSLVLGRANSLLGRVFGVASSLFGFVLGLACRLFGFVLGLACRLFGFVLGLVSCTFGVVAAMIAVVTAVLSAAIGWSGAGLVVVCAMVVGAVVVGAVRTGRVRSTLAAVLRAVGSWLRHARGEADQEHEERDEERPASGHCAVADHL
jgi:hypothetical protein